MEGRRLIICLHDVAPPFLEEIRSQIEVLHAAGANRLVLKVVPNWHGTHPLGTSTELIALLREEMRRCGQVVLHGLEHRPRAPFRGSLAARTRARLFAPGAAEFLAMDATEMTGALQEGIAVLAAAGLGRPTTFCAPAWLLPREGEPVLRAAGFRLLTGMLSVTDLASGRRRPLPGWGYMGAAGPQEWGVQLMNRAIRPAAFPRAPVVRIYLHPQGSRMSAVHRWVLDDIRRLLGAGWIASTYDDVYGGG
jgi:predicted deacetylase